MGQGMMHWLLNLERWAIAGKGTRLNIGCIYILVEIAKEKGYIMMEEQEGKTDGMLLLRMLETLNLMHR